MTRSNLGRIALVAVLLAPLVVFEAGRGYAPDWFLARVGGVPVSIWATVAWFFVMVSLAWRFAKTDGAAS
jgi:hypothetical protein